MYNEKQIENTVAKIKRFTRMLGQYVYDKKEKIENVKKYITFEHHYSIPESNLFSQIEEGEHWSGEGSNCWLKFEFVVPKELEGKEIFLQALLEGQEVLLWVDGKAVGNFVSYYNGNHRCQRIKESAKEGQVIQIDMECYAGHYVMGQHPFDHYGKHSYEFSFIDFYISVENKLMMDTFIDLMIVTELYDHLPEKSARRGEILQAFLAIHKKAYYDADLVGEKEFSTSIRDIYNIVEEVLKKKNGDTTAFVGLTGHSHIDTAWLWEIKETTRKCARTHSNQISLMNQFPNYRFMQSASYHSEIIRKNYPELFEDIRLKVKEGRYEPNGGTWVECDCNLASGESMIRQFLWGQRFTQKYFNYKADAFWLPDTFGYSAAIPQILKKCDIQYFLTTKMSWNDTNQFPYDTFYWEGIDGTKVLSHFNKTHEGFSPRVLFNITEGNGGDAVRFPHVSNKKLLSYGPGDGGGGPDSYMLKMADKLGNVEGCPRTEYMSVSKFMGILEESSIDIPVYYGELYLELHRGTLTNQHDIKRNNRLGEIALHDLEVVTVIDAVQKDRVAKSDQINEHYNTLLVNQFHDILPGSSIPAVHETCKEDMSHMLLEVKRLTGDILETKDIDKVSITNITSYHRNDVFYLPQNYALGVEEDCLQQQTENVYGEKLLAIFGIEQKPFSSILLTCGNKRDQESKEFLYKNRVLENSRVRIQFDEDMTITSYIDKKYQRELKGSGDNLNTLLMAEDVPFEWDNWDINWDLELKYQAVNHLVETKVISEGPVEFRIRNTYRISAKSTLVQDMILYKDAVSLVFEGNLDWRDDHRFLKTSFDVSIFNDFARQEIQFGYKKNSTRKNTSLDQAKFEHCNHKYTDVSDLNYGVSILNDCKYGVSVNGSNICLSLHKGGMRPDFTGDNGIHKFSYVFFPHDSGFSGESVVKPAYLFNFKPLIAQGGAEMEAFAMVSKENIIIDTIKPCEDNQKAFIMRLYECEGSATEVALTLNLEQCSIYETNMLEENAVVQSNNNKLKLRFTPFEIKTLMVKY